MTLFNADLIGKTPLKANDWYYLSFVYDCSWLTQTIYLNGKNHAFQNSSEPYPDTSTSVVIEKTKQIVGSPNYLYGWQKN